MAIVTLPNLGPDPFTVNASVLNGKVDPLATDYNGNIDNTNIVAGAAIANSKLNLATISQAVTMTGGLTVSTTALTMSSMPLNEAKGSDVASAAAPNITSATGNMVHITGTTTITSFATATAGIRRILVFDGILTFTHNSTSLILPTGANITTAAGDTCVMLSEGSGNWRCTSYQRKDGTSLVSSSPTVADQSTMETATNNTNMVTPLGVKWNPGVAKAWILFDGTAGTPSAAASLNVSSITDNGSGDWTINFTTNFSSTSFNAVGNSYQDSNPQFCCLCIKALAAGSVRVVSVNVVSDSVADSTNINVLCHGDQ